MALFFGCVIGDAAEINLVTNDMGMANSALFIFQNAADVSPDDIDVFVRLNKKQEGLKMGYNTSGRPVPFDADPKPKFTHDLRISDVPVIDIGGTLYLQFGLDIDEPRRGNKSLISLDVLQVYTSSIGGQTTPNVSTLGTLVFDLDMGADNFVRLDAKRNAVAGPDMFFYVPQSSFSGAAATDFVYLFSEFGQNNSADRGGEDWLIIPEPSTFAMVGCGLGLLAHAIRRRRRSPNL